MKKLIISDGTKPITIIPLPNIKRLSLLTCFKTPSLLSKQLLHSLDWLIDQIKDKIADPRWRTAILGVWIEPEKGELQRQLETLMAPYMPPPK
jgi:hypothetical protein